MPVTTTGESFWVQPKTGYAEQWAKNANQTTAEIGCAWADRAAVKRHLVGYTTWNGASSTLERRLPYNAGVGAFLYAETAEMVRHGFKADGSPDSDVLRDRWPLADWCVYKVTFLRPPYSVISDVDLGLLHGNLESERYISVRLGFNGRERRRPGYVFETVPPVLNPAEGSQVIDEVGFIPDWSSTILVTWWQVPEFAVPQKAIANCLAKVNSLPITIKGRTYPPETLLFKGVAQEIEPYAGADGMLYADLHYRLEYRPNRAKNEAGGEQDSFGWNGVRRNDGNWRRSRRRTSAVGTAPGAAPYGGEDFAQLFVPSSAV